MPAQTPVGLDPQRPKPLWPIVRRLIQLLVFLAAWSAALFLGAGRLDWIRGWILVAMHTLGMAGTAVTVLATNPNLIAARGKLHKDTKPFDKVFIALYIPLVFATPVVAGLDAVRFGWSSMPVETVYAGAVLNLLATALIVWTMVVNPFLESTVRIQTDRGHTVIKSGPYRVIRHPMYAGVMLTYAGVPLVLGSVWAFVCTGVVCLLLVWRTSREDMTLRQELPGYEEYTTLTRARLVPGLW